MATITTPVQVTNTVKPQKVKTRDRTVYYFRAQTTKKLVTPGLTLESALVSSWNNLPLVKQRIWRYNGKTIFGMALEPKTLNINGRNKQCHVLTIGIAESGAEANVIDVSKGSTTKSLSSNTHSAPAGSEYLDGEAFVCIMDNHILISPCDALRGVISNRFLLKLISFAKHVDAKNFTVIQVANKKTLQTVLDEGVKKIDLNTGIFMASYDRIKAQIKPNSFTEKMAKKLDELAPIITPARTKSQLLDYDSLNTKIIISHDMRVGSAPAKDEGKAITEDAKSLLESNVEGFTLVTRKGRTITPDKVVMNETVTVQRHGKSVKQNHIWDILSAQMQKYNDTGVLAQ